MTSIDSGYDTATILEVLIKTLVQKNVISEQEAKYIKETGRGATFRQDKTRQDLSRPVRYKSINILELSDGSCQMLYDELLQSLDLCYSCLFFVDARNAA